MARREKNRFKKFYKILSFLLILISIAFSSSLIYFNILPFMYEVIIISIILFINLIIVLTMLFGKKKKTGAFFSIINIFIMSIASFYILKTTGILNNLNLNYKMYNYSVVVLKESNYNKIKDINDKKLGYYKTEGEECKKSLKKISKIVSTNNKSYNDTNEMASDLINNKIDAILIEDTYLQMLNENDSETNDNNLKEFDNKTKVIYKFSIIVKTNDISKDIDVTKQPFSIYISGIDTYGSIASVSRSDVNMVVTVNPKTRQILLTSIPRDYYVNIHGKSGYPDKLTHAGLYGVDASLKTIEDLLDIDINYYVKVNFSSVIKIVDKLGGVNVYSDYDFTSIDGYNYTKGYNKVNGKEALSFARERKAFSGGDRQRIKDQQALLAAMFKKCTSPAIITRYNSLLNSVKGSFVTNMPTDRLTALIRMQISKNYKWTISSNSLDGTNSLNYTYSYSKSKLYVMEPDLESVENARDLIGSVIDGEKLESSYGDNNGDIHNVTQSTTKNSTNKTTTNKKDYSTTTNNTNKEGLKVSLGKNSVSFDEGGTYIYYKYTATYNGINVTNNTQESFSINGKTFNNYKDLVLYVSSLKAGTYNIVYKIGYNNEFTNLNQTVIIKSVINNNTTTEEETTNNNTYNEENDLPLEDNN